MKPLYIRGFVKPLGMYTLIYIHIFTFQSFPTDMGILYKAPRASKSPFTEGLSWNPKDFVHTYIHTCTVQSFSLQIGSASQSPHRKGFKNPTQMGLWKHIHTHVSMHISVFLLQIWGASQSPDTLSFAKTLKRGLCKGPMGYIHTGIHIYTHSSPFPRYGAASQSPIQMGLQNLLWALYTHTHKCTFQSFFLQIWGGTW